MASETAAASTAPQRDRTRLAPVAYDPTMMPSLGLVRSSRNARKIAKWLCWLLVAAILLMAVAPWQQSVNGSGTTTAFDPELRPQTIGSPIKGQIVRWGDGIAENSLVEEGQFIAEVRDLDPEYIKSLELQLEISEAAVAAAEDQLKADQGVLEAAKKVVGFAENQVLVYKALIVDTETTQDAFVEMAREKLEASKKELEEHQAKVPQLEPEYERVRRLQARNIESLETLQKIDAELKAARAKVGKAERNVGAAEYDLKGKEGDREIKIQKAQVAIDYAEGQLEKAIADREKAEAVLAKTMQELNKQKKELEDMNIKVRRQRAQIIRAPFRGTLVSIAPNYQTAVLKQGDPICTIVPDTPDRAVQIWLSGNDAPLVEPGRHVRLQFEGWPAVQFAGWPSVAVGTFGGRVVSVDATDTQGKGKFRVLVKPDPNDRPWPQDRFLRQGVRANGWVLLKQVPLWYEVWRRLNGFPPVVSIDEPGGKVKTPKLPK